MVKVTLLKSRKQNLIFESFRNLFIYTLIYLFQDTINCTWDYAREGIYKTQCTVKENKYEGMLGISFLLHVLVILLVCLKYCYGSDLRSEAHGV